MKLKGIDHAILSTLALAWAEELPPLSSACVYEQLHRSEEGCPQTYELKQRLFALVHTGTIFFHNSSYSLERSKDSSAERIQRMKRSARKIRDAKTTLAFLQAVPFIETAAITGSVAFGNAREESDVDIFCVVKQGRMWTARAFALLLAELLGTRRKHSRTKLCFNYFVTHTADIPVKNIAAAHMLAEAIPVYGKSIWSHFIARNRWIKEYLCHPYGVTHKTRSVHLPTEWNVLKKVSIYLGKLLGGTWGDGIEKAAKSWQTQRLERKARAGGDTSHLILTNDVIALHHPEPKNKKVMERYQKKVAELGLA